MRPFPAPDANHSIARARIRSASTVVLGLSLAVLSCGDMPTAVTPAPAPVPAPGKVLGVVAFRVNVVGPGDVRTSTSFFKADAFGGPRFSLTGDEVIQGDHIGPIFETLPGGGSFTHGTPGAGGYRYVFMSAKVRNAGVNNLVTPPDTAAFTTQRQNLTMIAIEVPAGGGFGIAGTPFSDLMKFDGTPADPAIAAGIVPTGAVRQTLTGDITTHSPDVLQVFTEDEVAAASPFFDPFPYGYMIYHVTETTNRTLAANPAPDQYDGIITLALKIPLQANPADDVYGFSMFFVLREDSETRITQSIEEQDAAGQAAFEARAAALATGPGGLSGITLLPGGSYSGAVSAPVRKLCAVRIAGTPAAPTAFLDGSAAGSCPTLTSLSVSSGSQGTTVSNVTLTGTNFVTGAGNTTVSVSGAGVTIDNVNVTSATSLTADFVIDAGATTGARTVTVTTAAGTSGSQAFTVNPPPPTLTSLSPNSGAQTGLVNVTLTGTGFVAGPAATTVAIDGGDVSIFNVTVASSTSLTADFLIGAAATLGARNVTVTTASGPSAAQTFTVISPPGFGSFTAAPSVLTTVQPTELSWSTTNATSCSIDNLVGTVPCTGTHVVTPGSSKTYTLTATGGGATIMATADVSVGAPGRFVYAPNFGANTVSMLAIDPSTGALTAIGGGTTPAGTRPRGVTVSPSGRYAYATNEGSDNISSYTIDAATGALTANGGAVATGNGPAHITVDPTERFVYVANLSSASVSMYSIGPTGQLTSIGTAPAGIGPVSVTVDPLGRYAYVMNNSDETVSMYVIEAGGTLTPNGTPNTIATGASPLGLDVDPTGRYAYVANSGASTISMYGIASDGKLTFIGVATLPASTRPRDVTVDPTGKYLYAAVANGANLVRAFTITSSTGVLVDIGAVATGDTPVGVAIDPSGKFVYVANFDSNNVSMYSINPDGTLTPIGAGPVAVGTNPFDITTSR